MKAKEFKEEFDDLLKRYGAKIEIYGFADYLKNVDVELTVSFKDGSEIVIANPDKIEIDPEKVWIMKKSDIERIIKVTAEVFEIHPKNILQRSRDATFVNARQCAIALITEYQKAFSKQHITFTEIAKYFNRDHSTMLYSLKQFQNKCETEPAYLKKAEVCRMKLGMVEVKHKCPKCGEHVKYKELRYCNDCYSEIQYLIIQDSIKNLMHL